MSCMHRGEAGVELVGVVEVAVEQAGQRRELHGPKRCWSATGTPSSSQITVTGSG